MVHLNPELLAGQALGHDDALDAVDLDHLSSCEECRNELHALRRTAELVRTGRVAPAPSPNLWARIEAELAGSTGVGMAATSPVEVPVGVDQPARSEPSSHGPDSAAADENDPGRLRSVPSSPSDTARRRPGRASSAPRRALVLLAAAVGLIVGVGGTVLVNQLGERSEVVARTVLEPLPGQSGTGTAELVRVNGVMSVRVAVDAAAPTQDYRELWLLDTGGERMYSLGVLPASGTGTYPVPGQLGPTLDGYTIVDVSLEPYDGDSRHSTNSLVRGVLPT